MPFMTNQRPRLLITLARASMNLTSSGHYPGIPFVTKLAHSTVSRKVQPYSVITLREIFKRMRPCLGRASMVSGSMLHNSALLLPEVRQRRVENVPALSVTLSWIIKTLRTWLSIAAQALRVSRVVKVLRQVPPTILSPILECRRSASHWPACSGRTEAMPSKRPMIASGRQLWRNKAHRQIPTISKTQSGTRITDVTVHIKHQRCSERYLVVRIAPFSFRSTKHRWSWLRGQAPGNTTSTNSLIMSKNIVWQWRKESRKWVKALKTKWKKVCDKVANNHNYT